MITDPLGHQVSITDLAKGIKLLEIKSIVTVSVNNVAEVHNSGDSIPALHLLFEYLCAWSHGFLST